MRAIAIHEKLAKRYSLKFLQHNWRQLLSEKASVGSNKESDLSLGFSCATVARPKVLNAGRKVPEILDSANSPLADSHDLTELDDDVSEITSNEWHGEPYFGNPV